LPRRHDPPPSPTSRPARGPLAVLVALTVVLAAACGTAAPPPHPAATAPRRPRLLTGGPPHRARLPGAAPVQRSTITSSTGAPTGPAPDPARPEHPRDHAVRPRWRRAPAHRLPTACPVIHEVHSFSPLAAGFRRRPRFPHQRHGPASSQNWPASGTSPPMSASSSTRSPRARGRHTARRQGGRRAHRRRRAVAGRGHHVRGHVPRLLPGPPHRCRRGALRGPTPGERCRRLRARRPCAAPDRARRPGPVPALRLRGADLRARPRCGSSR
jgi:hypothetical protein